MLKNLPIARKIALLLAIPTIAILVLAGEASWSGIADYASATRTTKLVRAMDHLAPLVHATQVERGRTAGFLGRGGDLPESLKKARTATSKEIKSLQRVLSAKSSFADADASRQILALQKALAKISEIRKQVDARSLKKPHAFAYYTGIISKLIRLTTHFVEQIDRPDIFLHGIAIVDLASAKELAGQERGFFNGVLGDGRIETSGLQRLLSLQGGQDTLLTNFLKEADKSKRSVYKKRLDAAQSKKLAQMRTAAIEAFPFIVSAGITQAAWFKETTSRILKLRELEREATRDLYREAELAAGSAFRQAVIFATSAFLAVALTGLLGLALTRMIAVPLATLSCEMAGVAGGHLDRDLPYVDRTDEVGTMARSLATFQNAAREKIRLEREAEEQRRAAELERAENTSQLENAVRVVGEGLRRLSDGDLTLRIENSIGEQFEDLRHDYNGALDKLNMTLLEVASSAHSMSAGCSEISTASNDLARRTEAQSSTLQAASGSVSSVTDNVRSVAKGASQSFETARIAMKSAETGNEIVSRAIEAMSDIEASSKEISSIISVIDEIAFQTNLLALNAGVEAARAGDAGRGFAVVATEVRALAQRSADAAQEIKTLIEASSGHVQQGVSLVKNTGEALNDINTGVEGISNVVAEISNEMRDQVTVVDQLNVSVTQLDSVTQENASMVEEANAATQTLTQKARDLATLVGRFKTKEASKRQLGQSRTGQRAA